MKKLQVNSRNLETSRIFPYIAWALIIAFGFIVYSLTIKLQAAGKELQLQAEFTEIQAKTAPTDIKNFEPPTKK
jgi:hypothetical protein